MFVDRALLRLSQAQLTSLEKCPRLFQHKHVEQLYSFTNPEQEEKQALGSKFHLLMQQREMGLPIEDILAEDDQLNTWMRDFGEVAPEIFAPSANQQVFRASEHYRTLQIDEYLFTVIYDLLILETDRAQIIDWKTYPKPANKRQLQASWQTRLYLYVLTETTNYPPEKIFMTYWFFQTGTKPTSSAIAYSRSQHEQNKRKLNQLLQQLTGYLAAYNQLQPFPQIPEGSQFCSRCAFARRCDREATPMEYRVGTPGESGVATSEINSPSPQTVNPSIHSIDDDLLNSEVVEEIVL